MTDINAPVFSMNAGVVSLEAMGRVDLAKMRVAAETMTNLLPTVLGPAKFRPGTAYYARTKGDLEASILPFVFNLSTKALIELTNAVMRIVLDGVPVTRPAVTSAVTNGTFSADLTGWTDADESGAVSDFSGGNMRLLGTGANYALRTQQVTTVETGVEHALRVIVVRGPVTFKVGSTAGADDYITETELRTGYHSLAFTPSGNFHISVSSRANVYRIVSNITVEAAGAVELTTPWASGAIPSIRFYQSGDVLFCACDGIRQQRIERRSQRSWSIVDYTTEDGPFRAENFSATTITPSAVTGNVTLTASRGIFKSTHVGALWQMTHNGQTATATLSGADQFTDPIRVTGVGDSRHFELVISGAFTGTITLQRSFGEPGSWIDHATYTAAGTDSVTGDDFDNQIVYYRLGFKAGDYTSGTPTATLTYASSVQVGTVRITDYSSATSVGAEVISTLGRATATSMWAEGSWSDYRGYPGSVTIHDGRLWWGWRDFIYGSVSDAFESFDINTEGDAGPIIRSVATGGFERIYWLLSNQRLLAGTGAQEVSIRSSSFDEPLTPTQFTARASSDRGSADMQAMKVDARAIFVQRSGKRIFELLLEAGATDFSSRDLTRLCPEICTDDVVAVAVQRQPDTRIWFVLDDGTCAVLTYEPGDEVVAWTPVVTSTNSLFKSVAVLPGLIEDEVWFVVERPVSATTRHYIEKLARMDECVGSTRNKTIDSHVIYSGVSATLISGLDHMIGQQVVVWANGAPLVLASAPLTVNGSGQITLPSAVTDAVIGLAYTGSFKSSKLAFAAQAGTALMQKKKVSRLDLLMRNVGWKGIRIGRDFSNLTGLPTVYKGKELTAGQVLAEYDQSPFGFPGKWDTDSRVCFQVSSPYPATFMAMVIALETHEGISLRQGAQQ